MFTLNYTKWGTNKEITEHMQQKQAESEDMMVVLLQWQEFATRSVAFFWHATAEPVLVVNIGRSQS